MRSSSRGTTPLVERGGESFSRNVFSFLALLRADAEFLARHNLMDYSLLVGVFRQQHVPRARHKFRNIAFIAVIDILQVRVCVCVCV